MDVLQMELQASGCEWSDTGAGLGLLRKQEVLSWGSHFSSFL